MNTIDFQEIKNLFQDLDIKLSYLTVQEVDKILNFPIKENNFLEFDLIKFKENNGICLIVALNDIKNYKLDSIYNKLKILKNLNYIEVFNLNKKRSALESGLGQYGKNQLIYNQDYGFHTSFLTFIIYNSIINLPKRNNPNYNFLDLCENCDLCIKNCPAQAIHKDESGYWVDRMACRTFYDFGEHNYIPSIKTGINLFLNNKLSDEELKSIHNIKDFKKMFGFDYKEFIVEIDNMRYYLALHSCLECINQKPCRKIEQKYQKDYCHINRMEQII